MQADITETTAPKNVAAGNSLSSVTTYQVSDVPKEKWWPQGPTARDAVTVSLYLQLCFSSVAFRVRVRWASATPRHVDGIFGALRLQKTKSLVTLLSFPYWNARATYRSRGRSASSRLTVTYPRNLIGYMKKADEVTAGDVIYWHHSRGGSLGLRKKYNKPPVGLFNAFEERPHRGTPTFLCMSHPPSSRS